MRVPINTIPYYLVLMEKGSVKCSELHIPKNYLLLFDQCTISSRFPNTVQNKDSHTTPTSVIFVGRIKIQSYLKVSDKGGHNLVHLPWSQ